MRKSFVDHVSDSFLDADAPLMLLISAAQVRSLFLTFLNFEFLWKGQLFISECSTYFQEGREAETEEASHVFNDHAAKLVEVANLACSMSNNDEGVKMVRYAAAQIESLCPQVINAATVLAARPKSKVAQENIEVFRDAWINQVRILTDAVDDITTVDDFLAVSENHILEDVNKCVAALQVSQRFETKL